MVSLHSHRNPDSDRKLIEGEGTNVGTVAFEGHLESFRMAGGRVD